MIEIILNRGKLDNNNEFGVINKEISLIINGPDLDSIYLKELLSVCIDFENKILNDEI